MTYMTDALAQPYNPDGTPLCYRCRYLTDPQAPLFPYSCTRFLEERDDVATVAFIPTNETQLLYFCADCVKGLDPKLCRPSN